MLRIGKAGRCGKQMFNILGNCYTVFLSGCIVILSSKVFEGCIFSIFSPSLHIVILVVTIPLSSKGNQIWIKMCSCLKTKKVEHILCVYLLFIYHLK